MTYVRGVMVPGISLDGTTGPASGTSGSFTINYQLPLQTHVITVWAQVPPISIPFTFLWLLSLFLHLFPFIGR